MQRRRQRQTLDALRRRPTLSAPLPLLALARSVRTRGGCRLAATGGGHGGGIIMDLLPLWSALIESHLGSPSLPPSLVRPATNSGLPGVATKTLPTSLPPCPKFATFRHARAPYTSAHHIRQGCPFIPRTTCRRADLIPASLLVFSLALKRVQAAHLLFLLLRSEARKIGIFTTFQWRRRLTRRLRVAAAAAMTFRRVGGQMDGWLDGGPFSNPLPPPPINARVCQLPPRSGRSKAERGETRWR